ncbi:hypothetical protein PSQ19_06445 [Devosia algicola]|uniref:Uncharacterized protein n=1 Tax=Devosia algicola TaxID=3026418 RepID=A0ABY7YQU5_9HYPH|nr:hypothetical protein [Devosia algicola]WDR03696.1 hypothetical protein PSQ19_06445 [Devosia algicola]
MTFEITSCVLQSVQPHPIISGRITGVVRVAIVEEFMGNTSAYNLDLKVRTDVANNDSDTTVRSALLANAAHHLNRIKARRHALTAAE